MLFSSPALFNIFFTLCHSRYLSLYIIFCFLEASSIFLLRFILSFLIFYQYSNLQIFFYLMFKLLPKEIFQEDKPVVQHSDSCNLTRAQYKVINDSLKPVFQVQVFAKVYSEEQFHICLPEAKTYEYVRKNDGKLKKIIQKKRKSESDDEYNIKNQKKDRNVTSNLVHHLIKFLSVTKGPGDIVKRIIEVKKMKITYEQFAKELQILSKNLRTYVTLKHIKQLWFCEKSEKQEFCLIMRILSKKFYNKTGFLSVYHSNKFNNASKTVHYKGLRNLIEVLVKKDIQQLRYNLMAL